MGRHPIAVSDHALLRYIERGYGIDLNDIRSEIIRIVGDAAEAGAQRFSRNGLTFAMRPDEYLPGRIVVSTILPEESPQAATRGGAKARGTVPGAGSPDKHARRIARGMRP